MTNLDRALKIKDIILPTKVCIVKAMVWLRKLSKAEGWRIDVFKLCCWRRLLGVPWTAKRWNQSILKDINPEYSLEGLMLKFQYLTTWCKEPTHWKRHWCWERLKARRELGSEDEMVARHHRLDGHEFEQTQGDSEGQGSLACYSPWGCKESDTT